jgi:hypothetical protein
VIDEGLSFSFGVASRLPRIFPLTGFQYGNYHLPVGVSNLHATLKTNNRSNHDFFISSPDWDELYGVHRRKDLSRFLYF